MAKKQSFEEIPTAIHELVQLADNTPNLEQYARTNRSLFRQLKEFTSFLPENSRARQRLWHIKHLTSANPGCQICTSPVSWVLTNNQYNRFCSTKCAHQSGCVRDKIRATNLIKYGVDWNITSTQSKKKRINTLKEKYGTSDPSVIAAHPAVITKRRATNLDRYGDVHNWGIASTVRHKTQLTMLQLYGVNHPIHSEMIREKIKATNILKYGVEWSISSIATKHKTESTNLKKYGTNHPTTSIGVITKIRTTTMQKYGVSHPGHLSQLSPSVINKLSDKNWMINQYATNTGESIATQLSVAPSTVYWHLRSHNIPLDFTKQQSQIEKEIVTFVSQYTPTIRCNDSQLIAPKHIDILINDKWAIEVNGTYWHGETKGRTRDYHVGKTTQCALKGIDLIHITDLEWIQQQRIIKSKLLSKLGKSNRIQARQCEIIQLTKPEEREFFSANHLQGYIPSTVCYGLMINATIVFACSFSQSRYSKKAEWELLRMCSLLDHNVLGGGSRLITHFEKCNSPISLLSYCDRRWGNGNVYQKMGFTFSHNSPPSYQYFSTNNPHVLYSRIKFQKHKLSKILPVFDANVSEWDNMKTNGYDRIWDCGNSVWIKQYDRP